MSYIHEALKTDYITYIQARIKKFKTGKYNMIMNIVRVILLSYV